MRDTENRKEKRYILLILLLAIIAVLVIPNVIVYTMQGITKDTAKKLESDTEFYAIENVNSVSITGGDGSIEVHGTHLSGIAFVPGKVLYCIEHGVAFWPKNPGPTLTIAEAQKYGSIDSTAKISWPKVHGAHRDREHEGENTYPYLRCVGNHQNLVAAGGYLPEAGYILTYPDMGDVTMYKQMAIWATTLNIGRHEVGNSLYNEAIHYREFHDQTTDNGQHYTDPDIKVTDETEKDKVTIKASYQEQTLTVGPFSIDYINGAYDDVAVGGISDMYMIGYNSENEIVKERIDIKKYIDPDGTGYEPEYFEPNEADQSFVDYSKQVYPKGKSAGEDTFQLKIDNPNADLSADSDPSEYVTKLKLHIEFKWMGVTEATICKMQGYYYTVNWECDDPFHCHHSHNSGCYDCDEDGCWLACPHSHSKMKCYDCNARSWLTSTPIQDHLNLLKGERKLFKTEIEIDAGDDNAFPITMDLGGKVWEDVPEGKESLTDGIFKEGIDRVLPNVKVTIYDEDGTMVNLEPTSEDTSDEQIMTRINPTYTDEKGDYLFKGLDPLRKYYVTFEYNGQVYLPTDYNRDVDAYNRVDWFWTSKGTEKSTDRDTYDKNFSEIGSSPANYKVPSNSMKIAPLTNGYNEAFSQYDLMGFKMTEDGDYVQETRLIDGFYTIIDGEIKETEEFQEGEISQEIKEFISRNRRSPEESDMLRIYRNIAGGDEEMLRKLQFIEDTKIESYTKAMDIISGGGTSRPNPDGSGSGGSTIVVNKTKLLDEVERAMRQLKIVYYDFDVEMPEGIYTLTIDQEFENIRKDDPIPNADLSNIDEVLEKFFTILGNMIQQDLRTDYINNYRPESSRYKLVNYLRDSVINNYRIAFTRAGMDETKLTNFNFKIVYKDTEKVVHANDFTFDNAVTTTKRSKSNNSNRVRANSRTAGYDLYPVYDDFIINKTIDMTYDTAEEARSLEYDLTEETIEGSVYKPIYPGQFYVNQGLWRRQEVDLALRKDILYAATRINGKTEVYEYNKRNELTAEQKDELRRLRQVYEQNGRKPSDYQAYLAAKAQFEQANKPNDGKEDYWQIQLRMRDYNNYYSGNYTKELYTADYNYRSASTNKAGEDKELQLYVTYKITVRNVSESILGEITEIVDYFDKDYTYRDDLSWVMYKRNSNSNNLEEINFTESDYYETIDQLKLNDKISSNNKGTQSSTSGQYEARSSECRSDMTSDYNDIYIKGLAGKKLASGEEAFIYLTFEVNKQNGKVITDEDNTLKQNYVEINGYKTYYKDGTQLPNGVTKGSNDVAGLIDINSTPGNLCKEDLEGNKYEKNFENDTDRAKSIKVIVEEDFIRSINGNVWEDQRTQTVSQAIIGDGMRQGSEIGVTGATVELVERLADGSEYVWQTTKTQNGKYEFKTDKDNKIYIIPGNYFIRFHYGDTTATANTTANGGSNTTSYNGQDFKSTVYQKDMKNGKELDEYKDTKIEGYDGKYQGTEVGYYDIKQLDTLRGSGNNFSDAKDIWSEREKVINYSNNQVTNGKAEILASPYTTGNTAELINNTKMTAVTGLIVLEGEYNRTGTDGDAGTSNGENNYRYGNDYNGNYTLNDVDLGITERPKAALELGKKITNVQIKLANGNILFDANKGMTDLQWRSGSPYKLNEGIKNHKYPEYYGASQDRYAYRTSVKALVDSKYDSQGNNGLIVATMDEELMQGANIKISYLLTVTNVGETDYEGQDFYYKGTGAGTVVTTKADIVADYVANNLNFKTDNNNGTGWQITDSNALELSNDAKAGATKYNNIIRTSNLNKALTPGDNTTVGLVLTQLINPENSTDDKTYDNIAEITTISNTVGRRMAYSIQGNQDPTKTPAEVDSVKSERVTILPPFGSGNIVVYIAITAGVLAILTVGIIFIKKKVLNK